MNERKFEIIEHTADKGIAACGERLEEAFENAAFGMFSLMADLSRYRSARTIELEVTGFDTETLFGNWLRELLFVFEVERVLPLEFDIYELGDGYLRAKIAVCDIGPEIEWLGSVVKAITYHEMKVEQTDGSWRVQVIVDV